MSGTIWTKFFWSDWDTDPALRLCSYQAQGLWMRMLCIAAAHDPIGYVAVAGRALDETSIARMTGGTASEVRDLLGELDRNGVFSRDRQGRIFSRRMVKDARRAAIARKNGKKGGNPSLGKGEGNMEGVNQPDNPRLKPQEPSANFQNKQEAIASSVGSDKPTPTDDPWLKDPNFTKAWDACTETGRKRSSRKKAWPEWRTALKREGGEALAAAMVRYVASDEDAKRTGGPGFHIWLKDARYEHWTAASSSAGTTAAAATFNAPQVRASIVQATDEDFARRYVDHYCRWVPDGRRLEAKTPAVAAALTSKLAAWAASKDVTIAVASANDSSATPTTEAA